MSLPIVITPTEINTVSGQDPYRQLATNTDPSTNLYRRVRAGFVLQGSSLNSWCIANCLHRQNASACLLGIWKGPKAQVLRRRLIQAAGLVEENEQEAIKKAG